jgi:hypothetical protein
VALGGSVEGIRLLSPDTISLIFDQQSDGIDLVLGVPVRFGIGFALAQPESQPYLPQGRTCYWGGSVISMDLDSRTTISYMMNKMGAGVVGSERTELYVRAITEALGV